MSFDHFGNAEDIVQGGLEAVYWSPKIRHTIVMTIEVEDEYKTADELADRIIKINDQALALEEKLPTL